MSKRPLKAKNLKVIDYIGTLYATFDGSELWKVEKVAYGILRMCDGSRTVDQIVEEAARKAELKPEEVRPIVEEILDEMTRRKFIEWV